MAKSIDALVVLAAHAPHEIPEWFEPDISPFKERAPKLTPSPELSKLCEGWRRDPCFDLFDFAEGEKIEIPNGFYPYSEEVGVVPRTRDYEITKEDESFLADYQIAWKAYWRKSAEWEKYRNQEKYFQWRVFYAEEVLGRIEEASDDQ